MAKIEKLKIRSSAMHASRGAGVRILYNEKDDLVTYCLSVKTYVSAWISYMFSCYTKCFTNYSFFKIQSGITSNSILEGNRSETPISSTNRRIMAKCDGGPINMANMPSKPPPETWRGRPYLGRSQLLEKRSNLEGTS